MSIRDRMRQRQAEARQKTTDSSHQNESESSALVLAEPPVIFRLRAVLEQVQSLALGQDDQQLARMSFILRTVVNEVMEELTDKVQQLPQGEVETYFVGMSAVIGWIGTGDTGTLPESFQAWARRTMGEPEPEPEDEVITGQVAIDFTEPVNDDAAISA